MQSYRYCMLLKLLFLNLFHQYIALSCCKRKHGGGGNHKTINHTSVFGQHPYLEYVQANRLYCSHMLPIMYLPDIL